MDGVVNPLLGDSVVQVLSAKDESMMLEMIRKQQMQHGGKSKYAVQSLCSRG
jgi:hypothetical protein